MISLYLSCLVFVCDQHYYDGTYAPGQRVGMCISGIRRRFGRDIDG